MSDVNNENINQTSDVNEEIFFLIFKDDKGNVLRVERNALTEVMEIIEQFKMPENTYFLIKGVKIV